ncbi:hypothetical protein Vi05172_g10678 [Venturia inaequalis]|nr:hypothetical protein Vi05172_g10678 [Venturia inaequalis]
MSLLLPVTPEKQAYTIKLIPLPFLKVSIIGFSHF